MSSLTLLLLFGALAVAAVALAYIAARSCEIKDYVDSTLFFLLRRTSKEETGLTMPPFTGKYRCIHCRTRLYGVPSDFKPGFGSAYGNCSICGNLLYFLVESTAHQRLYPMQFLTGAKWEGAASCPHPPRSRGRLLAMMQDLAKRMRYQFDRHRQAGLSDVWQTAEESLQSGLGDCEDHSILLADWLLSDGYDARVVLGDMPTREASGAYPKAWSPILGTQGEAHAWVAVRLNNEEYYVEATCKGSDAIGLVKDAKSVWTDHSYIPKLQFDRGSFWSLKQTAGVTGAVISFWDESQWAKGFFMKRIG